MKQESIGRIADALLYEGYMLYPYRRSALKNRYRGMFGVVFPEACRLAREGQEPWFLQTQFLMTGNGLPRLKIDLRFLQLPKTPDAAGLPREFQVEVEACPEGGTSFCFRFPQPEPDAQARETAGIEGSIEVSVQPAAEQVFIGTVRVVNRTPVDEAACREELLVHSLISTHLLLEIQDGEFVSLLDPPEGLRFPARQCRNDSLWPVLAGNPGQKNVLLAAPVILYDYPQVARESPADLFDASEIDELLTLRIRTLTDQEKEEIQAGDPRVRQMLGQAEALHPDRLRGLHGTVRAEVPFQVGEQVRLRPRGRADAIDLILEGKAATIAAIEQDLEGQVFLAVTVNDDPGQDLGLAGKPGHRFFFRPEEVERF